MNKLSTLSNVSGIFLVIVIIGCNSKNTRDEKSENVHDDKSEYNLAKAANNYYEKEEYLIAKGYYDSLIKINAKNPYYYFRRAYSSAVTLDKYNKETDPANDLQKIINDYLVALRLGYKNKSTVLYSIAFMYQFIPKYDSAIYYYDRILMENPNDGRAKKGKNDILKLMKNYK
jgi:tetratricopeptide (TPR) repeat protein